MAQSAKSAHYENNKNSMTYLMITFYSNSVYYWNGWMWAELRTHGMVLWQSMMFNVLHSCYRYVRSVCPLYSSDLLEHIIWNKFEQIILKQIGYR